MKDRHREYMREDADPRTCYVCGETGRVQVHHVSYFPEETVPVCSGCHAEIHDASDKHDDLRPDTSRPDNYEKRRRHEERIHQSDQGLECGRCETPTPVAELYGLNFNVRDVLDDHSGMYQSLNRVLESPSKSVWCVECISRGDPEKRERQMAGRTNAGEGQMALGSE